MKCLGSCFEGGSVRVGSANFLEPLFHSLFICVEFFQFLSIEGWLLVIAVSLVANAIIECSLGRCGLAFRFGVESLLTW